MATLIGDVFTESPSRFHNHNMIRTSTLQHQHSHHFHQNPPIARSHEQDVVESQSHTPRPTANTSRQGSASLAGRKAWEDSSVATTASVEKSREKQTLPRSSNAANGGGGGGASRLPSPPSSSSSSSETPSGAIPADDGAHDPVSSSSNSSTSTATTVVPPPTKTMPSPAPDSEAPRWASADTPHSTMDDLSSLGDAPSSPLAAQKTIHVRDLAHIQTLAKTDILTPAGSNSLNDPPLQQMKYEISAMPINDIIEMVAALLTKITTTNDLQHDALNRNAHHLRQAQAQSQDAKDSGMSPLSSSVLAFHGKNVPSISILSYLSRIHKYCPTTYEVFLSLLVYFDRMTERVNDMVVKSEEARRVHLSAQQNDPGPGVAAKKSADGDTIMNEYNDEQHDHDDDDDTQSDETDEDLADTTDEEKGEETRKKETKTKQGEGEKIVEAAGGGSIVGAGSGQATYFVVDSYNIHRLIIAGVTCSSKFFSDVFYTNSRYAKVGGLPLAELNHLELQFLLLNDFRLAVPVEDLEAYATMLVEFYAREVVAGKAGSGGQ
ncbi:cyclin-domain-containing protein [Cladorrhinum sp. PSN259]|nr:cyclin-domain-containing protein [Cladorrhinum sp. PSN259]